MKKLLLSSLLFLGLNASAQLADGSVAPDFTLTDIDGKTHHLYQYLDSGYTVIIDVSATWCGPCWSYHNTGALEDLWVNHGPKGGNGVSVNTTDNVIVLFLEGELSNTTQQLHGPAGGTTYANKTQGDWVTGVKHPIIDLPNSTVLADYNIHAFPTVFKICPNRLTYDIGQATATQAYAAVQSCPPPATADADVKILSYSGAPAACSNTSFTPSITFQNNSTSTLTGATLTVSQNNSVIATGSYSGSLAKYGTASITASTISNFAGGTLTFTLTTTGDINAGNGIITKTIDVTSNLSLTNSITVNVTTDRYGSETTWAIKTLTGAQKKSGGPYADQSASGSYAQAPSTAYLPNGCYYLELNDDYADGFDSGSGDGKVELKSGTTVFASITTFTSDYATVAFKIDNTGAVEVLSDLAEVLVYPNPANEKVHLIFDAKQTDYEVAILDLAGRVVSSDKYINLSGAQNIEYNVAGIQSGNYIVKISNANGAYTSKLVIE